MRDNKGITMISLVITIIVLLILTSITIYNGTTQLGLKRVNYLYSDIDTISTKVAEYYLKNEKLPVFDTPYVEEKNTLKSLFTANGAKTDITNINDGENYYVIDLSKLDNLTLNYGDDYKEWERSSSSDKLRIQNVYIINSVTHQIYFPHGIRVKDEYYFTRNFDENEVTPIVLNDLAKSLNVSITNISGNKVDNNKIAVIADVELSGELINSINLNSLEYAWTEITGEIENEDFSYTRFNPNNNSNDIITATLSSKGLSNNAEQYRLYIKAMDINGNIVSCYSNPQQASPLTSTLPANYQKVEYLESTGTQYIDTEVIANDVDQINVMFSLTDNKAIYGITGGGWTRDNNTFQVIYNSSTNLISLRWGTASISKTYDTNKHNAVLSRQKISIDDTQLDHNYPINDSRNVYLFARRTDNLGNGVQQYAFCRIYNCTIKGNNINKHFIPCYRKADAVNGFYDLANGRFYINANTTGNDFIAGANME